MSDSEFAIFMGVMVIVMLVSIVISIAVYVVQGYGYYRLYKKMGKPNAWMAWVPYVNTYALAEFVTEETDGPEWIKWCIALAPLGSVIQSVGAIIPFIGIIFSLIGAGVVIAGAVMLIVYECIYVSKHGNSVLEYVLIFIFPIILPFLWYKNYDEVSVQPVDAYTTSNETNYYN